MQNAVTGEVSIWRMFETTRLGTYSLPSVPDTDWRIVGVADFNAYLAPDILWQHQSNGLIALWVMGVWMSRGATLAACLSPMRFQTRI